MSKHVDRQNRSEIDNPKVGYLRKLRSRFSIALIGTIYLHGPLFHQEIVESAEYLEKHFADEAEYEEYLRQKAAEEQVRKAAEEKMIREMTPQTLDEYEEDKAEVQEMNEDNRRRIQERAEEAKEFKKSLLAYPDEIDMSDVFFPIEYYSQGVSQSHLEIAREVFRLKNEELDKPSGITTPARKDLRKIIKTFMPKGSHNVLKSSAVETLACNLCEDSQSCVARARMMVMAAAKQYPELANSMYFQEFGDHFRTLVEIDGDRHILEGGARAFPDWKTREHRSRVMPVDVWIQIYAGANESEFEDQIEMLGPEPDSEKVDYKRITNNLVAGPKKPKGLGNLSTAESWYKTGRGRASRGEASAANFTSMDAPDRREPVGFLETEKREKMTPETIKNRGGMVYLDEVIDRKKLKEIWSNESDDRNSFYFDNLTSLDLEQAKTLVEFMANPNPLMERERPILNMYFPVLEPVTKEVMEVLAKFRGQITFKGFKSLPMEMAEAMYESETIFVLHIEMLTTEAAAAIAGTPPKPAFRRVYPEPLGLEIIRMPKAEYLDELNLPDMENVDRIIEVDPQEPPIKQKVTLRGLKYLSAEAASALAKINGDLGFHNGDLSYLAGRALEPHTGLLTINLMNNDFAAGSRNHKGIIQLYGQGIAASSNASVYSSRMGRLDVRDPENATEEDLLQLARLQGTLRLISQRQVVISPTIAQAFARREHGTLLQFPMDGQIEALKILIESNSYVSIRLRKMTPELEEILLHGKINMDIRIDNAMHKDVLNMLRRSTNKYLMINGQDRSALRPSPINRAEINPLPHTGFFGPADEDIRKYPLPRRFQIDPKTGRPYGKD